MHPLSPHAPTRTAVTVTPTSRFARKATFAKTGSARGPLTTKGKVHAPTPLDALAAEIHGKLVPGSDAARAHVAADELTLRRPRRPAARRASFRTPPASR